MMINNVFTVNGVEYQVKNPGARENKIAQMEYNRAFNELIKNGTVLRAKLNEYMIEQGLWSDEKQKALVETAKLITELENQLEVGGIKLSKAVEIAKRLRSLRKIVQDYMVNKSQADSNTAEGQAENIMFQKLLTVCLVYKNDSKTVFPTLESLLELDSDNDKEKMEVATKGFDILANIRFKNDDDFESKLPENKFLKTWNLIDDKLRYINSEGKLVNEDGKLVDEKGRLINEDGHLINNEGKLINEEGDVIVPDTEKKPFLDEDGNPVTPPNMG